MHLDEIGQGFIIRLIMCLKYTDGHKNHDAKSQKKLLICFPYDSMPNSSSDYASRIQTRRKYRGEKYIEGKNIKTANTNTENFPLFFCFCATL